MRYGSQLKPHNKFLPIQQVPDFDHLEWDDEYLADIDSPEIQYLADHSKSVISENNSPDINFRYSLNSYRGCVHGCSYCYARPTHEYLGWNAGLDFETKIYVKHRAPELFKQFLARPSWQSELIAFSGVTDCYQPAERKFQLTRQCLQVAETYRQPIGIVTKNALVIRDLDLLQAMARQNLVNVSISITTLNAELARIMEPKTSIPTARLRAVKELSSAGVPVKVMVSPIIPGLNDQEIPEILEAAHQSGARSASMIMLRLPTTVEPVFLEWLKRTQPSVSEKVINRIRSTRQGDMYQSRFGQRMTGDGEIAEQIQNLFQVFCQKYQLDQPLPSLSFDQFRPPGKHSHQLKLFG